MNTEALRSLAACYRDPFEAQCRAANSYQLFSDMKAIDAAADCIDRLRGEIEKERTRVRKLADEWEQSLTLVPSRALYPSEGYKDRWEGIRRERKRCIRELRALANNEKE